MFYMFFVVPLYILILLCPHVNPAVVAYPPSICDGDVGGKNISMNEQDTMHAIFHLHDTPVLYRICVCKYATWQNI